MAVGGAVQRQWPPRKVALVAVFSASASRRLSWSVSHPRCLVFYGYLWCHRFPSTVHRFWLFLGLHRPPVLLRVPWYSMAASGLGFQCAQWPPAVWASSVIDGRQLSGLPVFLIVCGCLDGCVVSALCRVAVRQGSPGALGRWRVLPAISLGFGVGASRRPCSSVLRGAGAVRCHSVLWFSMRASCEFRVQSLRAVSGAQAYVHGFNDIVLLITHCPRRF